MARLHPFGSSGLYVSILKATAVAPSRVVVATADSNVAKTIGIVAFNRAELKAAAAVLLTLAEELGP